MYYTIVSQKLIQFAVCGISERINAILDKMSMIKEKLYTQFQANRKKTFMKGIFYFLLVYFKVFLNLLHFLNCNLHIYACLFLQIIDLNKFQNFFEQILFSLLGYTFLVCANESGRSRWINFVEHYRDKNFNLVKQKEMKQKQK